MSLLKHLFSTPENFKVIWKNSISSISLLFSFTLIASLFENKMTKLMRSNGALSINIYAS